MQRRKHAHAVHQMFKNWSTHSWSSITGNPSAVKMWKTSLMALCFCANITGPQKKHDQNPSNTFPRWPGPRPNKSQQVCEGNPTKWYTVIHKAHFWHIIHTHLEMQTLEECITHPVAAIHLWLQTGCLHRADNGMTDFVMQQVDGWGVPLKTLWSPPKALSDTGKSCF